MSTTLALQPRAGLRRVPRLIAGIREHLSTNSILAGEPCRLPAPVRIPVRRPLPLANANPAGLALGTALGLALAIAPAAFASTSWERTADGRLVDVEVLVDGSAAPLYAKSGSWDRRYFQAFRGRNYSLAVTNNSGQRAGVLISVDGLNVVNGERSSLAGTEPMYVLGPYERAVIRGWRTSLEDVRRFVFVDEQRSYAERTGQASGDMGWIRVLSFREQRPQVRIEPRERGDDDEWQPFGSREEKEGRDAARAPNAQGGDSRTGSEGQGKQRADTDGPASKGEMSKRSADSFHGQSAPESNPGTGWGDRSADPVQRTVFLAAHSATDHIILRYEYEPGLRALGIHPRRNRTRDRDRGELSWGFARPPRW